jgi:hypothetical protein
VYAVYAGWGGDLDANWEGRPRVVRNMRLELSVLDRGVGWDIGRELVLYEGRTWSGVFIGKGRWNVSSGARGYNHDRLLGSNLFAKCNFVLEIYISHAF